MPHSFRTIVKPSRPTFTISHQDRIMTIGSCFSGNIGRYFQRYKFPIHINPFGQQYNPHSVSNTIKRLLEPKLYTEADLEYQDELYHSYDHHGDFSRPTKEGALREINSDLLSSSAILKETTVLFLTFGSAHCFRLKENNRIVSNCHKMPGSFFDFGLLKPEEIVGELESALKSLWKVNPSVKVVLTVSPVRYFAFGHFENSVSKGHLFAAVQALREKYPALYYFPAYELVMDDLRDYRFFADDMLHPNYQATEYVWQAMCQTLLSPDSQSLLKELDEILIAANHRPRNPESQAHQKFIQDLLMKMDKAGAEYGLDFSKEREGLLARL